MSVELFGLNVDNYTLDEALESALTLIDKSSVSQIVTINPEMFECAEKNAEFKNVITNAEMVIPDGIGVKLAMIINGYKSSRIPGVDFAKRLLFEAAKNNIPVAIIGAKEDVVSKAVENIRQEISGINIVYYCDGYFTDDNEVYKDLNEYSPKLILVAMGSPRQEFFIYNAKTLIKPALMIGIGGSLDVWSGNVKRAPKIFQTIGLEWLYRTITQPSRIKRIFPTLPLFLIKAIKYRFIK